MTAAFLLIVFLLLFTVIQGSIHVIEQGKDVLLDVKTSVKLDDYTDFSWVFNGSKITKSSPGKNVIYEKYKARAEIYAQNFSLLLKSLQPNDSGKYIAIVSGDQDQTVAEHEIIVQSPVSPVEIIVTSISSHPCNLSVTCSSFNSHISKTVTCDQQTCTQGKEDSLDATKYSSSLNVSLQQGYITCIHSNTISWKQDKKEIKSYCGTDVSGGTRVAVGIISGIIVMIPFSIVLFKICKRKNRAIQVYAVSEDISRGQTLNQNAADNACESTYALVGFQNGPTNSTRTKNPSSPETVYAQVNIAAKPNSRTFTANT